MSICLIAPQWLPSGEVETRVALGLAKGHTCQDPAFLSRDEDHKKSRCSCFGVGCSVLCLPAVQSPSSHTALFILHTGLIVCLIIEFQIGRFFLPNTLEVLITLMTPHYSWYRWEIRCPFVSQFFVHDLIFPTSFSGRF